MQETTSSSVVGLSLRFPNDPKHHATEESEASHKTIMADIIFLKALPRKTRELGANNEFIVQSINNSISSGEQFIHHTNESPKLGWPMPQQNTAIERFRSRSSFCKPKTIKFLPNPQHQVPRPRTCSNDEVYRYCCHWDSCSSSPIVTRRPCLFAVVL